MTRTPERPEKDAALEAARRRLWPEGMPALPRSPHADASAGPVPEAGPGHAAAAGPGASGPASVDLDRADPVLGAALRRIDALERSRRSVSVRWMAVMGAVCGIAAAGVAGTGDRGGSESAMPMAVFDELVVDELTVRGALRMIDERGLQIASLGRVLDEDGAREPLTLSMSSPTLSGARETVRLSALETGGTLELHTPDRAASIAMLAGATGPFMVLREDERTHVISEEAEPQAAPPRRPRAQAPAPPALPAVSAPASAGGEVDLGSADVQRIDEDLMLVGLERRDGRLSGRVINASAVRHVNLRLALEIDGARAEIRVPMVSPGNSTGFEVALPDGVDPGVSTARVSYAGSTVRYHRHQPWGASATHGD